MPVARARCSLHLLVMRFAIGGGRRQGGIEAAESACHVATFFPSPRAHAGDRKVGNGDVSGLDVHEQRRLASIA